MNVTLRQLEVFVAVIDHGGFGAAADELRMTQSAVSHTIATFERLAEARLVERSGPVAATPVGRKLLPHARFVLAGARSLTDEITAHSAERRTGTVRMAIAPTIAHRLIPDLLATWAAAAPGVEVRLFEGGDDEVERWLDDGTVDAAVLMNPAADPSGSFEIARDEFRALVHRRHPLASAAAPVDVRELFASDPFLDSSTGCWAEVRRIHELVEQPYAPAQRVQGVTTLLGMVEAGLGFALLPSLVSSMLSAEVRLVEIEPRIERRLVLTGPADRPWHPQLARLVELARAA